MLASFAPVIDSLVDGVTGPRRNNLSGGPCRDRVMHCGREVSGCLVGLPVFKTGDAEDLGVAGSIPVHLRYHEGRVPWT